LPFSRRRAAVVALAVAATPAAMSHADDPALPTKRPEPAPVLKADAATHPEPPAPADPDRFGRNIQRTMTLLATSTPQRRNKVRILFYGQSITEQDWTKAVADDLRRRFPDADLTIENRAIGGFASQLLINPLPHDVYTFYPDLVIFHVYGANQQYEEIIKGIRSHTAAEILMQTDHVGAAGADPNATQETNKGLWWDNFMNGTFLPATAKKYGCGIADDRRDWLEYLKVNGLKPQALLNDGVHLNAWGNFVMAKLVERNLVYRPDLPRDSWKDLTRLYTVGTEEARWKNGRLIVPFDGNRVEVIAGTKKGGGAKVLIDGKAPSALPELYALGARPEPRPWSGPLALARVDHEKPLVAEDWTLTVTSVSDDGKKWGYDVVGSVTGPDGSGTSDATFVSKSGRAKIEPAYWFRGFNPPLPVGTKVTWKTTLFGADAYAPPASVDPANPAATTLAQGIANGPHTLEIVANDPKNPPSIAAVRAYRPPVK
jgi:hypothetical protein